MINNELTFRFLNADRLGQTVRLPVAKCSIGAGENCTLRLAGKGIRPVHCFIVRGPGGTVVRRWSPDTRLNGRPFRDAALNAGDRLSLGPVELEVVDGVQANDHELEELRDQLRQSQEQLETQAATHARQTEAWQLQRQAIEEKLDQSHDQVRREGERCTQQIDTFAKLQSDWHAERDELVARCTHLQAEFDAALARAEAANLTRRAVTEMWPPEANSAANFDATAELEAARAELAAAQSQLHAAQQQLATEVAELGQRREACQAEYALGQSAAADRQAQLDRLETELRERQTEIASEATKLQRAREALDAEHAALQNGHRHLRDRLDARLAEVDTRETRLVERQADLQQAADKLADERRDFVAAQRQWQEERRTLAAQLEEQQSHAAALRKELAELRSALDARLADDRQATVTAEAEELRDSARADELETVAHAVEEPVSPPAEATRPVSSGMSEAMLALQRLREAALNETDETDEGEEDVAVAEAEPVVEEAVEPAAPTRGLSGDSDVSIEDYMVQLMQRLRGKSEDEAPLPKRKPSPPAPRPQPLASSAPAPVHVNPSDCVKLEAHSNPPESLRSMPPRAAAPEQTHSLQAMRELANQSARSAIDTSSQRRWQTTVRGKFAVSIAAGVCGGALLTFGNGLLSWTTAAALGSFVVAGLFAAMGYKLRRQGVSDGKTESNNGTRGS